MAEQSFPYDAGAGATISEADWQRMARRFLNTGVIAGDLDQLAVSADGLTRSVTVATGHAFIEGFFYRNDAAKNIPLDAADATNPRIDRIVVRMDRTANTAVAQFVKGTPAASPTAPALTLTDTVFDLLLADVTVPATAGVIVAENVTDRRTLVRNLTEAAASAAYVAKATPVLGYAQSVTTIGPSDFAVESDLTGLSVAVDLTGKGSRRLLVTVHTSWTSANEGAGIAMRIKEGGTTLQERQRRLTNVLSQELTASVVLTPSAGPHTYTARAIRTDADAGNKSIPASASQPAYILVQDLGAA